MKIAVLLSLALAATTLWSQLDPALGTRAAGERMAAAARAFSDSLEPALRAKACLAFEGEERMNWHFVPRERKGVALGELSDAQRVAAHRLLQSALSSQGYLKVQGVLELEQVLHELESRPGAPATHRDRGHYDLTIYGAPGGKDPWGWSFEGHHLSLNFCSIRGELRAFTPAFIGASPAEVRGGPKAGLRVLGAEEDLARELALSFDAEQAAVALSKDAPPEDVLFGPGRELGQEKPLGIAVDRLNETQRGMLLRLIEEFSGNISPIEARGELERMPPALEAAHFLWMGGLQRGQPCYFRVQGPHYVLEYDNVREGANHTHSVWRESQRDFGRDLLLEHHQREHADK